MLDEHRGDPSTPRKGQSRQGMGIEARVHNDMVDGQRCELGEQVPVRPVPLADRQATAQQGSARQAHHLNTTRQPFANGGISQIGGNHHHTVPPSRQGLGHVERIVLHAAHTGDKERREYHVGFSLAGHGTPLPFAHSSGDSRRNR